MWKTGSTRLRARPFNGPSGNNAGIVPHWVAMCHLTSRCLSSSHFSAPVFTASSPYNRLSVTVMSATLEVVIATPGISPDSASIPRWAFIGADMIRLALPAYPISGSRTFSSFLVETGAAMGVVSTQVPLASKRPHSCRRVHGVEGSDDRLGQSLFFQQAAELGRVVASGTASRPKSMLRNPWKARLNTAARSRAATSAPGQWAYGPGAF